jgi:hypothetical protein
MSYGTIKVDTITFTDNSVDKSVSLSGLIQNPTFTGNITVTGTISGDVIRGGTTVSGATVTGTTANFVSGVFTTQISGATVTGTTASFTSGVFTNISGTTATITSGIIASGTAAAPSLAILADLDTGLFSPGANQLAVATSGTGRLFVDASGNVGVGTSPDARLTVQDGATIVARTKQLAFDNYTNEGIGTTFSRTSDGAEVVAIGVVDTDKLLMCSRFGVLFGTGGGGLYSVVSERMRITEEGLVGIGTSTVSRSLHIAQAKSTAYSSSDFEQDYQILRLNNTTDDGSVGLEFQVGTNGQAAITADEVTDGNTDICFGTRGSGARTEKVRITSAGLVGIGTSTPAYEFQVNAASDAVMSTSNSSSVTSGNRGTIAHLNSDNNTCAMFRFAAVTDNVGTEIQFHTRPAAGSLTQSMTLDSTGRLGIGSSSPTYFLQVKTNTAPNVNKKMLFLEEHTPTSGWSFNIDDNTTGSLFLNKVVTGTESTRITVTNSGNVGIGTTSPLRDLHVSNGGAEGYEFGPGEASNINQTLHYNRSTSVYIENSNRASAHSWDVQTSEKMRLDTSGRLLVGTSSSPSLTNGQYANAHFVGNTFTATGDAALNLGRGVLASSGIAADTSLGSLHFTDSAGAIHATINGATDAVTGSNDYPGRLVFSTTADGASSPTERMRISSVGNLMVGTTTGSVTRWRTFLF